MKLDEYVTLGRSGLRVSPLCLGTMTFGTDGGWGCEEAEARAIFDLYVEQGGNFVDTADLYVGGQSEEMLGRFIADKRLRDRVVLATKFSFNAERGNPNAGGNGRKNIRRAVEGSLRRLRTDHIDVYWLHAWDKVTPVDEVVASLDDLVRAGKVLHVGLSDVPAWYASRYTTLAEAQGKERPIALQLEYSLVERTIEHEHVPMARELGMGIMPWSPLGSGFLTGKYRRAEDGTVVGTGRLDVTRAWGNPAFDKLTERNWHILDALLEVSALLDRPPAQVALRWALGQAGVSSVITGVTKVTQLETNLAALDLTLPVELKARLDLASRLPLVHPYMYFGEPFQSMLNGGVKVAGFS